MKTLYQASKEIKELSKTEQDKLWEDFSRLVDYLAHNGLKYNAKNVKQQLLIGSRDDVFLITKGLRAKDILVLSNQGQIIKRAKLYANSYLKLDELIQIGNLGVCKALLKYKPGRNTKFSSYAFFWIKAMMIESIRKTNLIITPVQFKDQPFSCISFSECPDIINQPMMRGDTNLLDNLLSNLSDSELKLLSSAFELDSKSSLTNFILESSLTLDETFNLLDSILTRLRTSLA